MAERLGASYTMKGTRTQDPASHYQSRPNGSMASGVVGSPTGMLGNPGMVPVKGGATGGALQPVTPRPPRGGSGPIFQNPRPIGGQIGGGGVKSPGPRMGGPIGGGGVKQMPTIGSMPAKQQPGRAPAHYGPIQANTGTGSTKAPLARSLGQMGPPKLPTPGGLTARKR